MKSVLSAAAIAAALAFGSAQAATIDLLSVTGVFQNTTGGANVVESGDTVNWGIGIPVAANRSGYVFEGTAPPPNIGIAPLETFTLGTFTHENFPIQSGGGITGTELLVNYTLRVPSPDGVEVPLSALFKIDHFETPNAANPCADGGPNGEGVNINGCADRVRISTSFSGSQSFVGADGVTYFLQVAGFGIGGTTTFWTIENASNSIELVARFAPIPLPAAGWMLIAALSGLGVISRRKRMTA